MTIKMKALAISALILASSGYGLMKLRVATNGLRNAVSPSYWADRAAGIDLYNPHEKFFKRGPRGEKLVCLTFDDGPHPESLHRILKTLKEYNGKATFFVVGSRVKQEPGMVREILAGGNEVGNHTQDHIRLDTLPMNKVKEQIDFCETNVKRAAGVDMKLFRPPGMRYNQEIMDYVQAKGYITVGWNVGAKDFTGKDISGEVIKERVLKQLEDGVIILLHDNPLTADALPGILEEIQKDGYKVVTVREALTHLPRPVRIPQQVMPTSSATVGVR